MQLYTKLSPTNIGMLSKQVAFSLGVNVTLTEEERTLAAKYQFFEFPVGTWHGDKGEEHWVTLSQAMMLQKGKGYIFTALPSALALEASLIEGCKRVCGLFDELRRINAGGERMLQISADAVRPVPLPPPVP